MNAAIVSDNTLGSVTASQPIATPQRRTTDPSYANSSAASCKIDRRSRDLIAIARNDIQSLVKARPGAALTGAVILGFIAGRLLSRY